MNTLNKKEMKPFKRSLGGEYRLRFRWGSGSFHTTSRFDLNDITNAAMSALKEYPEENFQYELLTDEDAEA